MIGVSQNNLFFDDRFTRDFGMFDFHKADREMDFIGQKLRQDFTVRQNLCIEQRR